MAGFEEVGMLDYFDVVATQTANWKRDEAMALAEDWITTYGDDLKAIICENDDMGMGALSAAQAAGRDDIIIGGVDGLDDAVAAAKGEEVEPDTRIPFRPITKDNVDAYLEGGVDAISGDDAAEDTTEEKTDEAADDTAAEDTTEEEAK